MQNYMPMFNSNMPQQMQQMQMQQLPQGETLIPVRGDDEVLRYPIAPGNSLSFKNVTEPFIYTKTLTSQFSQPVVEKYRLVKETAEETPEKTTEAEAESQRNSDSGD